MANGTEGISRFTRAILGGQGIQSRAAALGRQDALREALSGAQIDNTRNEASLRGVKLGALNNPAGLAAAFGGFGLTEPEASGAGTLAQAGFNPSEVANLITGMQKVSSQRNAAKAALSGDYNAANANLFGTANGPQALSKVEDGVTLNPLVTPDQNSFTPTDIGQAMIGADNARAAASYASAARQRAGIASDKAANHDVIDTGDGLVDYNKLTGEVKPVSMDGNQVRKAAKAEATLLPEHVADAVLGKVTDAMGNATPDPQAYGQFQAWQAEKAKSDPRYANAAFAVQRYQTEAPVGSRMALATTDAKGNNHLGIGNVTAPGAMDLDGNPMPAIAALLTGNSKAPPPDNSTGALHAAALNADGSSPAKQGGSDDVTSQVRAPSGPLGEAATLGILNGPPAPSAGVGDGAVATPTTEAEYNALPPGTLYQHPDGTIKKKGG